MTVLEQAQQLVDQAMSRARDVARRGVLKLVADDYFVQAECYDGERFDDVELWQQFGLASRPPTDGEVLLILVGGRGEGAIAVATTDRSHRPTGLSSGDSALYGESSGSDQARVIARADGDIDVFPGGSGTVNIGTLGVQAMLLGGDFDTALRILFTTAAGGLADVVAKAASAFSALGSDAALSSSTQDACNAAASSCGAFAGLMTTFLAGDYLADQGRVS